MAVSAFHGDRNGVDTNMYGQRNGHKASPPFVGCRRPPYPYYGNALSGPLRGWVYSISRREFCQSSPGEKFFLSLDNFQGCGIIIMKRALPISGLLIVRFLGFP